MMRGANIVPGAVGGLTQLDNSIYRQRMLSECCTLIAGYGSIGDIAVFNDMSYYHDCSSE